MKRFLYSLLALSNDYNAIKRGGWGGGSPAASTAEPRDGWQGSGSDDRKN